MIALDRQLDLPQTRFRQPRIALKVPGGELAQFDLVMVGPASMSIHFGANIQVRYWANRRDPGC